MAVPTHFKITFRGHFEGTPEQWSFGTHWRRSAGAGTDAGLGDVDMDAVLAATDSFMASAFMGTVTRLDDIRLYQIGTDGKAEADPVIVSVDPGSPVAGSGGMNYPPQIAVVVTKVADNRGPAKLGRFYLPCLAMPISTGGRISEADATSLISVTTAWLKAISDAIDLPGTLASSGLQNVSTRGGLTGTMQGVDHIRVGRAFDTLRTRRNAMLEEYVEGGTIDW